MLCFKIILHDACCRNSSRVASFLFATQALKKAQGTAPEKFQRRVMISNYATYFLSVCSVDSVINYFEKV